MNTKYLTLFISMLKISACTFGGGFVIVPLMRKRFVLELGWIDENEMLDMITIAQSSPGAIAVNAAILIGYRVAKIPGALISILGTIIPPFLIISIISIFYKAFRDNPIINLIMAGMSCGVAAVIFDVVIDMTKSLVSKKSAISIIILVIAFIAVRFLNINILFIILTCGFIGAIEYVIKDKRKEVLNK